MECRRAFDSSHMPRQFPIIPKRGMIVVAIFAIVVCAVLAFIGCTPEPSHHDLPTHNGCNADWCDDVRTRLVINDDETIVWEGEAPNGAKVSLLKSKVGQEASKATKAQFEQELASLLQELASLLTFSDEDLSSHLVDTPNLVFSAYQPQIGMTVSSEGWRWTSADLATVYSGTETRIPVFHVYNAYGPQPPTEVELLNWIGRDK